MQQVEASIHTQNVMDIDIKVYNYALCVQCMSIVTYLYCFLGHFYDGIKYIDTNMYVHHDCIGVYLIVYQIYAAQASVCGFVMYV